LKEETVPEPTPNPSDDELAAWLAAAADRYDRVPADVVAAGKGSFTWRTVDSDLAALAYDSLLDEAPMAGARGTAGAEPRTLTFEAPDLTVEVEVEAGGTRTIVGQLVPGQPGDVEVRHPHGSLRVEADEVGVFRATGIPPGPVSLLCRTRRRPETVVETDWVVL
jgi:hypothetical protein